MAKNALRQRLQHLRPLRKGPILAEQRVISLSLIAVAKPHAAVKPCTTSDRSRWRPSFSTTPALSTALSRGSLLELGQDVVALHQPLLLLLRHLAALHAVQPVELLLDVIGTCSETSGKWKLCGEHRRVGLVSAAADNRANAPLAFIFSM